MRNQFSSGLPGLLKYLESVKVNIGVPVVRTQGGRSVHGQVITKFSGMGRFTYPWCSAGERESSAINSSSKTQERSVGPGEQARQKFSSKGEKPHRTISKRSSEC